MKLSHVVLGLMALGTLGAGAAFFEVFEERPVLRLDPIRTPPKTPPTPQELAERRDNAVKLVMERNATVGLMLSDDPKSCATYYSRGVFLLPLEIHRKLEAPLATLNQAGRSARTAINAEKTDLEPLTDIERGSFFYAWKQAGATDEESRVVSENDTNSPIYCSATISALLHMVKLNGPKAQRVRYDYVARLLQIGR